MNVASIIQLLTLALQLLDYFINMEDKEWKAVNIPQELKSKLALVRERQKVKEQLGV